MSPLVFAGKAGEKTGGRHTAGGPPADIGEVGEIAFQLVLIVVPERHAPRAVERGVGCGEDFLGERVWRLPLDREYSELIKGRYADIVNATSVRKASSITAAEFLKRFVEDVPWAHLDIAGTAWDVGRPYASKGGSGFGVRLLVELARRSAA